MVPCLAALMVLLSTPPYLSLSSAFLSYLHYGAKCNSFLCLTSQSASTSFPIVSFLRLSDVPLSLFSPHDGEDLPSILISPRNLFPTHTSRFNLDLQSFVAMAPYLSTLTHGRVFQGMHIKGVLFFII